MNDEVLSSIFKRASNEAFARKLGMRLVELEPGHAIVEMVPHEDNANIFGMTHGGAIFSLIDEAFQLSGNAHGTVAFALNMTVTYHQPPDPKSILRAESKEIHLSSKTATYEIKVTDENGDLISSCQALAYRKGVRLPFLDEEF
jgi:acyl-CoA thioesterase